MVELLRKKLVKFVPVKKKMKKWFYVINAMMLIIGLVLGYSNAKLMLIFGFVLTVFKADRKQYSKQKENLNHVSNVIKE